MNNCAGRASDWRMKNFCCWNWRWPCGGSARSCCSPDRSCRPEIDRRIRARFPFGLTSSQNEVVSEIAADLSSGRPMTRLLQGDVGSGKTVVSLYACLVAVANRKQAAIMAPTEILAEQHFRNIEQYLAGAGCSTALAALAGRRRFWPALKPASSTWWSAHSVNSGRCELKPGRRVVDEQHKFGVMQQTRIRTKGRCRITWS